MAGGLMFMRPDELMTLFGTVTGGAATGYDDDHLVDGRPGRPAKEPAGSPSGIAWVITGPASKEVGAVVVARHNLQPALAISVTGGGGLTASLVAPAAQADDIPLNAWAQTAAPVTTNTITVTIPANVEDIIVGEVLAGKLRDLTSGILLGARIRYLAESELPDGKTSSLLGYPDNVTRRAIDIEVLCTTEADKDALVSWWQSTKGDTRPSVLIPFPDLNDAWVGHIDKDSFSAVKDKNGMWVVTFTFTEDSRGKW